MSTSDEVQTVHDGKHVSLVRRGRWEYVTRKGVCGIVGIIAVTEDRKLILIEQQRKPVNAVVIEIPAGLAGDQPGSENEPLEAAARRELMEETGYEAASMREVAAGTSSAGITDELITLFLATGVRKTGAGEGDGSERITTHAIPITEVLDWLVTQRAAGKLIDLKVYSALAFVSARA